MSNNVLVAIVLALGASLLGCGQEGDHIDAAVLSTDAARGAAPDSGNAEDAAPPDAMPPDAGVTACGPELECDAATEVCVGKVVNIALQYSCEPVPPACDGERSCHCLQGSMCLAPWDDCFDTGENAIRCECLECG